MLKRTAGFIASAAIFILVLTAWSKDEISIRKGPYLIYNGNRAEMQVNWQLDAPVQCSIRWGRDEACREGSATSIPFNDSHQHQATLINLKPGTKYFYKVAVLGKTYSGTFRSAPAPNAKIVKFLAFGDTRTAVRDYNSVCAAMSDAYQEDPEYQTFALHVGDWVGSEEEVDWGREFFSRSAKDALGMLASLPIQGCRGNHEGNAESYNKFFGYPYVGGRGYWSYDYGPAHFVIVDQYDVENGPSDEQVEWIRNDLSAAKKEWKFMVFHAPAWTAGGHENNERAQKILQPLCEQYGVDVVFSGHNHYYARALVNGVHHITTGGGGARLSKPDPRKPRLVASAKAFQFCQVDIDGKRLEFRSVGVDGRVLDSFAVSHETPKPEVAGKKEPREIALRK